MSPFFLARVLTGFALVPLFCVSHCAGQDPGDPVRDLQTLAVERGYADWGRFGVDPQRFSSWMKHSNRLIPIYTYGIGLGQFSGANSVYRDPKRLQDLYGRLPPGTLNPTAEYCDQTDVYRLQQLAVASGKKYIVLIIFDGTDWHTTRAAAIVASGKVAYHEGRGTGLAIQDYRHPAAPTDFGFFVTSPSSDGVKCDVSAQKILNPGGKIPGGYDWRQAGETPWETPENPEYLLGLSKPESQAVTDSAASATSMTAGVKTYNDAINVDALGHEVTPISRQLQERGWSIGVVTSVPISHATPAAAYANNVHRDDFQDLTRDLVGLPSVFHPDRPLPGVDVLLGAGWGENKAVNPEQGTNFVPGNQYITDQDLAAIDIEGGGRYHVARRRAGVAAKAELAAKAKQAAATGGRLFGFYGVKPGHLPYQTADGGFNPTISPLPLASALPKFKEQIPGALASVAEAYSPADLVENPTLSHLTQAALKVLSANPRGFWLMIEAGDVDWANHQNNLDNAIGAVLSGDDAFRAVVRWIEAQDAWRDAAVIVTADHGHYFLLERPETLLPP